MPPSNVQPGPHDPYNASSVKLAEATRIRLVLPGLSAPEKEETTTLSRAGSSKIQAEAAVAKEKARKKLLKIQGIANQADKAHSSVIVDTVVLEDDASAEADDADDSGSSATGQGSEAVDGSVEGSGSRSGKRSSNQGNSGANGSNKTGSNFSNGSNYTPSAGGAGTDKSAGRSRKSALRSSGNGARSNFSSRLALPSPGAASDGEPGSAGSRGAATSGRVTAGASDKPYIPIWDRSPSTPAEEKRAQATTHKVFQPVAIKTFSPTLGSLGVSINQDAGYRPQMEELACRLPVSAKARKPAAANPVPEQGRAEGGVQAGWPGAGTEPPGLRNKSKSFTAGYPSPSQLLEKLTQG